MEQTDQTDQTEKTFRIANKYLLLTYKTHLKKKKFRKWFREETRRDDCHIYMCHENGDANPDTPYEHTHVAVFFEGKAYDIKNCRKFDYKGIHPRIDKVKNKKEFFKNVIKYIEKEDKDICENDIDKKLVEEHGGDFTKVEKQLKKIWEAKNIQDAFESMENLRDAQAVDLLFRHRPMELPEPDLHREDFFEWQEGLFDLLNNPPRSREIYWYWSKEGGVGKTEFAKYCCLTEPEKFKMMNNVGRIADFSQNIKNFFDSGWRGNVIFLNLSRAYADRSNIYESCEIIKDGLVTCTKYAGGQIWLPKMHVVVFANFKPDKEKISRDRLIIRRLDKPTKHLEEVFQEERLGKVLEGYDEL